MINRRIFWPLGAILLLILGNLYLGLKKKNSQEDVFFSQPTNQQKLAANLRKPDQKIIIESETKTKPSSTASLAQWIESESEKVESSGQNNFDDSRLSKMASMLSINEQNYLYKIAIDLGAAAKKKILAVYLLSIGEANTMGVLSEFITTSQHDDQTPSEVHSPEEARQMQNKALKIMALDSLAEQAKSSSAALNQLEKAIQDIQDSYLRDYAKKKLANLKR